MAIKFYKEGNNYVLGDHQFDYKPIGAYKADVHLVGGVAWLALYTQTDFKEFDSPYFEYVDSTDTPYTSISALMAVVHDMFAGGTSSPSGEPARISATLTRPADTNSYTAGDHINSSVGTPVAITLNDVAIANGGGGFIMDFKMETDATTFAGATLRFWLFNDIPTGIVGDNVAYVNSFSNADKRMACGYFDCTFDPLLGGSDCVIGKYQPNTEYVCATASKNMYILVQTLTAVSTPKSAGVFKFYFNVVKTK